MASSSRTAIDGTVGALIEALSQYSADTEVVVGDGDWWRLITAVRGPCGDGRLSATVAFEKGETVTDGQPRRHRGEEGLVR